MISSVAHQRTNGRPTHLARTISLAEPKVDRLLELREALRRLQAEERVLAGEVLGMLEGYGLGALQGRSAVAILDERTALKVDPKLFHDAAGPAAYQAMTVSVTQARRLLDAEALLAIAETSTTPVLRVEPLPAGAGTGGRDERE